MTVMPARVRRLALAAHLTVSVGWIGAAAAYLAIAVAIAVSRDARTVSGGWAAMELVGWAVLVPLSLCSVLTGIVMAMGTRWGLLRHYWVTTSFALTLGATAVLVLHMPDVSASAAAAHRADTAGLDHLGSDLFHSAAGIVVLLGILVLNVYKPRGLTRYGWRKERAAQPRQPAGDRTAGGAGRTRRGA